MFTMVVFWEGKVALGLMPLHFRYETGILHIACQHSRIISTVLLILSVSSVFS